MGKVNTAELVCGSTQLFIFCPLGIGLFIFHGYKYYQDMYTIERKSLSHRRAPGKKTKEYIMMNKITLMAICCYMLLIVAGVIGTNFIKCDIGADIVSILTTFLWYYSKIFLNLSYMYRLHQCYSNSAFGYGKKRLITIAILIILFENIFATVASIGIVVGDVYQWADIDEVWPHICTKTAHEDYVPVGGVTLLVDLILLIGAIVCFMLPINKLLKVQKAADSGNPKKYNKMLYAGVKCKICVISASITSLIWTFSILFGIYTLVCIMSSVDFVINMICLMMMTPYYDDNKYYKKLCCITIFCCDRGRKSFSKDNSDYDNNDTKNKMEREIDSTIIVSEDETQTQTQTQTQSQTQTQTQTNTETKSIDTMDVPQQQAQKYGNQNNLLSNKNYDNEEVP